MGVCQNLTQTQVLNVGTHWQTIEIGVYNKAQTGPTPGFYCCPARQHKRRAGHMPNPEGAQEALGKGCFSCPHFAPQAKNTPTGQALCQRGSDFLGGAGGGAAKGFEGMC